jgi:hypothetical protein
MEAISRQVREIGDNERRVCERVIGRLLQENQKVIVPAVTPGSSAPDRAA